MAINRSQFKSRSEGVIDHENQMEGSEKSKSRSIVVVPQIEEFLKFSDLFEETPYTKNFVFDEDERTIKFCGNEGNDKDYIQVLCKTVIPKFEKYSFGVKIVNSKKTSIFISVVSKASQKNARSSFKSGNAMAFYGGGRIWYGSQSDFKFLDVSTKLSEGDKVVTCVSRSEGNIQWLVNEKLAGRLEMESLREEKLEWVPYF